MSDFPTFIITRVVNHKLDMNEAQKQAVAGFMKRMDGPEVRLTSLLARVRSLMRDSQWWTLRQLAAHCCGSEASVSARLRDLRKPKHGGHTVERKRIRDGLFAYRLLDH